MIQSLINDYRDSDLFVKEVDLFYDLNKTEEWDNSLPTLISSMKNKPLAPLNGFLKDKFSFLNSLDLSNVLIAGGFVSNYLLNNDIISDIDMFLYGLEKEDSDRRMIDLINQIIKLCEKDFLFYGITRSDLVTTITFLSKNFSRFKELKFQVMHRLYRTKSEVLHGFDLGSSAVGYDGERILFTSLSKFSYKNMVNIVDCSRRSTTYEKRLVKYFKRGFDIILPKFNLSIIPIEDNQDNQQIVLNRLKFTIKSIKNNEILVDKIESFDSDYSDYDEENGNMIDYNNYKNIIKIFKGKNMNFYSSSKNKIEYVVKGNNKELYVYRTFQDVYKSLLKKIDKNFPIHPIECCFPLEDINNIFINRKNKKFIDELVEKHFKVLTEYLSKNHPIKWITQNPGTQISGSFNPIIEDESLWYKEYFNE